MAGHRGKIAFSVVPSRHVPLLIGRDFLTPAGAVVDMGEKTLRIGTGVENLVVSRAGHLALQNWFTEVNAVLDIPARLRERRKRHDSSLLRWMATVLLSARGGFTTCTIKRQLHIQ